MGEQGIRGFLVRMIKPQAVRFEPSEQQTKGRTPFRRFCKLGNSRSNRVVVSHLKYP